jgi:hypothetical protein
VSSLGQAGEADRQGDRNAEATGGERQICYKLFSGEAGWILRPTGVLQF